MQANLLGRENGHPPIGRTGNDVELAGQRAPTDIHHHAPAREKDGGATDHAVSRSEQAKTATRTGTGKRGPLARATAAIQSKLHALQLATDDKVLDPDRLALHPELQWDATLRRNNDLHPSEVAYLARRRERIVATGVLKLFLGLPEDEEVHPDDVPIIGLGGSGGGYRSHLGFIATIQAAKTHGFWDLISYMAGVSAACWTIAAYLTFASCSADVLLSHFSANAGVHPISPRAFRAVIASDRGGEFLFAPLATKVRKGLRICLMDLWSTLSTAYMWLPLKGGEEAEGEEPKLREEWFQWSKVWDRAGLLDALEPFPILTSVRHVVPWDPHTVRRLFRYVTRRWRRASSRRAIEREAARHHAWYQWWEANPLEVGCDEMEGWVPAWAFGRKFRNGRSTERTLELPLSLLLGPATSAPSAPLVDQLATIARHLPEGLLGRTLKRTAAGLVRRLPAEAERFGNKHPLHPGQLPNPFYLVPKRARPGKGDEHVGRIELMDAGLDNNMPMQPFLHPSREVDILINCDFSSDVQQDTAMARLRAFCRGRGLVLKDRNPLPSLVDVPRDEEGNVRPISAEETEARFTGRYAQVLDCEPMFKDHTGPPPEGWYYTDGGIGRGTILCNEKDQPQARRGMLLVYAPHLPNKVNPEFDPSTAVFSDSYNLVWTPEQVQTIAETQRANIADALSVIREAVREAYEERKRARLQREANHLPLGKPVV